MNDPERYQLFCKMMEVVDIGFDLMQEYDSQLHNYHGTILYQAESQMIKDIGDQPGITAATLAQQGEKSNSAYSQLTKKLKDKGWVRQERSEKNNREYRLYLTEEGNRIYLGHQRFEAFCYQRTFEMLDKFSVEELQTFVDVQAQLNKAFQIDVEESRTTTFLASQAPAT